MPALGKEPDPLPSGPPNSSCPASGERERSCSLPDAALEQGPTPSLTELASCATLLCSQGKSLPGLHSLLLHPGACEGVHHRLLARSLKSSSGIWLPRPCPYMGNGSEAGEASQGSCWPGTGTAMGKAAELPSLGPAAHWEPAQLCPSPRTVTPSSTPLWALHPMHALTVALQGLRAPPQSPAGCANATWGKPRPVPSMGVKETLWGERAALSRWRPASASPLPSPATHHQDGRRDGGMGIGMWWCQQTQLLCLHWHWHLPLLTHGYGT